LADAVAKQVRCTVGEVAFAVKSGNIVEQKCDAIVNSTDEKLDLSRGMFVYLFNATFHLLKPVNCTVLSLALFAYELLSFIFCAVHT